MSKSEQLTELLKTTSSLAPCDPAIYTNGIYCCIIINGSAKMIDRFIQKVTKESQQPTDWNYVGGRAVIKTTGNITRVQSTIADLMKSRIFDNEETLYSDYLQYCFPTEG